MRIKSISLKGYKRFKDLTIDLGDDPSRIVALVGPNGCGKSSVFDALLFLQGTHASIGSTGCRGLRTRRRYARCQSRERSRKARRGNAGRSPSPRPDGQASRHAVEPLNRTPVTSEPSGDLLVGQASLHPTH